MRKKRTAILAGVLGLALMLAGCGGGSAPQKTEEAASEASKKQVVIILPMDHLAMNQVRDAMTETLTAKYGDGITIEVKNANGDQTMINSIMQEAVSGKPDLLLPIATGTAQIAATTTSEIPIVFSAVTDPVEAGLCPSWEEAGANVTGVSDQTDVASIIDFALELVPGAKTFGLVYSSSEVNSGVQIEQVKKVLEEKGLFYKEGTITNTSELQQVVGNLAPDVDVFYAPTDNNVATAMPTFQQVANKAGKPIFPGAGTMVASGGTGTVGLDYSALGRQTAEMAIRILDGQSVAENPPEKVTDLLKLLNEDQVTALGIEVPEALKKEVTFIKTDEQ
ncbi:MAG: ABC transporter substrate-binding protein [Ndongobacter sp.]|nr:ABC transporter substrate-binding protein [Ndongobacter sp.]